MAAEVIYMTLLEIMELNTQLNALYEKLADETDFMATLELNNQMNAIYEKLGENDNSEQPPTEPTILDKYVAGGYNSLSIDNFFEIIHEVADNTDATIEQLRHGAIQWANVNMAA